MGYFVHDAIDMLLHERTRWAFELVLHHAVSIFLMLSALLPRKFIFYIYWALLMELNSIFLHSRTIMQLSESAKIFPNFYSCIRWLNIFTFVIFRFGVQIWLLNFILAHWHLIHAYYAYTALFGGVFFLVINTCLFSRILASDGFFSNYDCQNWIMNRDLSENLDTKK
uniref:TLC domain-containing protein n=1 Tax=Acrobeloides nanus TaxID=290746 RepID=A0A914CKK3_9BILA